MSSPAEHRAVLRPGVLVAALVAMTPMLATCGGSEAQPGGRFTLRTDTPLVSAETAPLTPAALSLNVAPELVMAPWAEGQDERLLVVRDAPRKDEAGRLAWTVRRLRAGAPGQDGLLREARLVQLADGSVAIEHERNVQERVLVVFEPPLVVVPAALASLSPGEGALPEPFVQELRMRVHPLDDESRTRAEGEVRNEIAYRGPETIGTPAGEFEAHRLRSVFTADLGPSKVRNVNDQWFVPGLGLVAERSRERTEVMSVPIRNNAAAWVLAEEPVSP